MDTGRHARPGGESASARDRLLIAARELLAEVPMDRITVRMIAARAGVGHVLITRHFGSRAALLNLALGVTLIELADEIARTPDIHAGVRYTLDRVLASRELTSAINVVTLQSDPVDTSRFPVVEAFTGHLEAAGLPAAEARELAATLTLMIFSVASAENLWLRMSGHQDDRLTGRYRFLQILLGLVDATLESARRAEHGEELARSPSVSL